MSTKEMTEVEWLTKCLKLIYKHMIRANEELKYHNYGIAQGEIQTCLDSRVYSSICG